MNEWWLLAYPVLLLGYLMLAARWQPRHERARLDDARTRRGRRD